MNKGPPPFSSFRKKSKDPLTNDYPLDHKFSISTPTVAGVALRSTATNKDGVSTVDIGALYKSKKTSIVVKFDAQSNITLTFVLKKIKPLTNFLASFNLHDFESGKVATTLTFTEIAPSTNTIASFRLPNLRSSKLKLQYFDQHATLTSTMALNEAPTVGVSTTIGTPTIAIGAKAANEIFTSKLISFAVGINFNRPDSTASLVL
ncbi:putative Porin domain superfamily, eukaryotic porin/Tom40 [Helianthus annuus]|nr:putative Porin domain superfamily, eukaryotic porin/Tom40 [Helianthus annuus]